MGSLGVGMDGSFDHIALLAFARGVHVDYGLLCHKPPDHGCGEPNGVSRPTIRIRSSLVDRSKLTTRGLQTV